MFRDRNLLNQIASKTTKLIDKRYICEFLYMSENVTYIVYNGIVPLYTIRISRPSYRTFAQLKSEIDWLIMLSGMPVPEPVKVEGSYINIIEGYYVTVFKYIIGKEPEYNNTEVMYQCGKLSALLHKSPKPKDSDRPVWSIENMTSEKGLWGDWHNNKKLSSKDIDLIEKNLYIIKTKIKNYKTNKYGLIHFDLRMTNLIESDKLYAIDFDDCGYGYYIQDLASALSFMEDSSNIDALKNAWYKGYEEIIPLDDNDKTMADSFIILRRIQLLAWITSHSESDYVKTVEKDFVKNTLKMLKASNKDLFKQ